MTLKEYMPDYYRGNKEMETLLETEDYLFSLVNINFEQVKKNQYISTASQERIGQYESILGITPAAEDSLEFRRSRVLNRWISISPYTEKTLYEQLYRIQGNDNFSINPEHNNYKLYLRVSLPIAGQVDELGYIIGEMVPANIEVISTNKIEIQAEQTIYLAHSATYARVYTTTNDFNAEYVSEAVMNSGNTAQTWSVIATK